MATTAAAADTARSVGLLDIQVARKRISDSIYHSPCPYSLSLSKLCSCRIYCKLDHLQMTGSFKERGARNKLLTLTAEQRQQGVVAASAGNHALGLAYHGQLLNIPVTVVMPRWAPLVKVSNAKAFGATVILHGDAYDDAKSRALLISAQEKKPYIPGFDDPEIIAGQGTLGLEILDDVPDVDAIIAPIGGGGLIAGIATAAKSIKPGVRIIGVEPINAPTMYESLKAGHVVKIPTRPTLADGLAVAEAGKLCFDLVRQHVDEVMLVDEADIARSVLKLLELEKAVVEGAGAVPLAAAMKSGPRDLQGKRVVLVLCGGNIDVTTLSKVIDRGLAAEGRLCRIIAHISDRPGGLAALTTVLAKTGASVKEIDHDRHFSPPDVGAVNVVCTLETRDFEHIREIHAALAAAQIDFSTPA